MALPSVLDWRNIRFGNETSAEDLILTLETNIQALVQQFANRNETRNQVESSSDQNEAQVHRSQKATATPTPTAIPTPTRITIDKVLVVHVELGNVRTGPGMNYDIIGNVQAGDRLDEVVEESSGWYRFCCLERRQTWLVAQQSGYGISDRRRAAPTPECRPLLPEVLGCRRYTDSSP